MNKKVFNINGLSGVLLMGTSALVLSACVPEDEVASQEQDLKHIEAMTTSYAQAFEHYSNQALNAVVNSTAWQEQFLPEGSLDLSEAQFGNLNLGQAENYLQSAHCNISGDAYHMTWFDKADGDGDLFLKGLGVKQSGLVSLKIKDLIPNSNFGIMGASSVEMSDGATTLSLSGACSTINIPQGSAVAAIRIPAPVQVSEVQEKFITRAVSCGADEEGGILQRVDASFTQSGGIVVQGQGFDSETDVIADNSLTWNEISNECIALSESVTRVVQASSADAVNMASLSGLSSDIADSLLSNLSDLECKDVKKKENPENGDEEENKEFDTCEDAGDLDLLEGMNADELRLLRAEENIIVQACPAQPNTAGTVTVNTSHNDFTGVHNALNDKQGSLSYGEMTGKITLKKISRFYKVINDYGGETGVETNEVEVTSHEGVNIECSRPNTLYFTCNTMFPDLDLLSQSVTNAYSVQSTGIYGVTGCDDDVTGCENLSKHANKISSGSAPSGRPSNENGYWTTAGTWESEDDDPVSLPRYVWMRRVIETNSSGVQNTGLTYTRSALVSGWSDPVNFTPNDISYGAAWDQLGNMGCTFKEERTVNIACPFGYSGSRSQNEQRTFTADEPGKDPEWSDWAKISQQSNCTINYQSEGGGCCFVSGTKVRMADGSEKNIEDIVIGDLILAKHGVKEKIKELQEVLLNSRKLVSINKGPFFATEDHTFKSKDGWVSANPLMTLKRDPSVIDDIGGLPDEMQIGTILITEDGEVEITSLDFKNDDFDTPVYNLFVENTHSYFADGYLVHNKDPGGSGPWCFFAGTKILMADGSIKNIEHIRKGEITATGEVLQKSARYYDYALMSAEGNSCIRYDDVYVTGFHVINHNGKWDGVQKLGLGIPARFPYIGQQVYNLITDKGYVIVQGKEHLHYFADLRNNVNGEAERGFNDYMLPQKKII
jgi:hypothetical protein